MTKTQLETRMADYLDDLLEEEAARAVEAEIAQNPVLFAEVCRIRALLYHPYPVGGPAADLSRRIVRQAFDRPVFALLRYAAVFAAGLLSAFLVRAEPARTAQPRVEDPGPPPVVVVSMPRRIH